MAFIQSVIRKKQFDIASFKQQAIDIKKQLIKSESELSRCQLRHEQEKAYLWRQLNDEQTLCVQRLARARFQESATCDQLSQCREHQLQLTELLAANEKKILYTEKTLEKLHEKAHERRSLEIDEQNRQEAQRIDEWITNRLGKV